MRSQYEREDQMRFIKKLGLAPIAVVGAMAFMSASAASAYESTVYV
jgi:hypothetical protein